MFRIPFIGAQGDSRDGAVSSQESHNMLVEAAGYDTRGQGEKGYIMVPAPGLEAIFSNVVANAEVRGIIQHQSHLYAVIGNQLFRWNSAGTRIDMGAQNESGTNTTLTTSTGKVSMASSGSQGGQVAMVDGSQIYCVYHAAAQANIADIVKETSPTTIRVDGHPFVAGDVIYITGVVDAGAGGDDFSDLFNGLRFIVNAVEDADNINIAIDSSTGITNDYDSGGIVYRERMFSPGLATNTGDNTWGTFSSEDNDSIGEAAATDAVAWTTPAEAASSNNDWAEAATVGQIDTSATSSGTQASSGSTDNNWSNVANVASSEGDDASSSAELSFFGTLRPLTNYIHATNFSFAIPSAAQIVGVTASIERAYSDTSSGGGSSHGDDATVQLIVGGSRSGTNQASGASWPSSDASASYGGTYDTWGLTLTPTQVNASNFGIAVRLRHNLFVSGEATQASGTGTIDHITLQIHYVTPTDYLRAVDRSGADLSTADTILGIEVDIEAAESNAGRIKYQSVQLVHAGQPIGNDKGSEGGVLTGADAVKTFGGSTDRWGMGTNDITPTIVNSEQFGVQVSFTAADAATASDDIKVDFINVKIYYQSSGGIAPQNIEWMDDYFIVNETGSGRFYITGVGAQTWDVVNDFATAQRDPDDLVAPIKKDRELWLIGEMVSEAWWNSGADFPFDPIQAGVVEKGTASPFSVARWTGGLVWLTQDPRGARQVISLEGQSIKPLSYPGLEYNLQRLTKVDDAIGFVFMEAGHELYVLTFPSDSVTWAHDFSTGAWTRWYTDGDGQRHLANCYAFWPAYQTGTHIVGGYNDGTIYRVSSQLATDRGSRMKQRRVGQHMHSGILGGGGLDGSRRWLFYPQFEIEISKGHAPITDPGKPELERNRIGLSWSDDDGKTFSDIRWRDIPAVGQNHRLLWNMLGKSKDRVWAIDIDADIAIVITGAHAYIDVGSY
jgi:hypothetical protein